MAVCVVCLLCAEHLPCKEHVSLPSQNVNGIADSRESLSSSVLDPVALTQTADIPASYLYDKRKDKTKIRQKRHADHHHGASEHHHHTETPEVTKEYIQRLFANFSNNDTMNVNDFERMMQQLKLTNLAPLKKTEQSSKCMSGLKFLGKMTETKEDDHDDHHADHDGELMMILKEFCRSL
jgi:solute carrier family 39 (zinc transporter), member 10